MRTISLLGLALILSGCMAEVLTTTAIQGELQAKQASAAMGQLNNAKNSTSRLEIEHAIKAYQAEFGYYPSSLASLVPTHLPAIPTKADGSAYGYDPQSGQLLDQPMAASAGGVTAGDQQLMSAINAAIQQYGQQTGFYPNTLDDLYPAYLKSRPVTEGGQAFYYDNKNGAVVHPLAGQSAPRPQTQPRNRSVGGSGGGLLGESMTGIGIQQELNSMGSGGANAAQSRSRENVQGVQQDHNQNINKQMQNLGL